MNFNDGAKIKIHNTDNDTEASATIINFRGDYLRVLIDNKIPLNFKK